MNGDGTESDWQGLVSEVRPRRRPGGQGRLERPPRPTARAPQGGRAARGRAGDAPAPAPARCAVPPALPGRAGRRFAPRHLVPASGEGPSHSPPTAPRQGLAPDWRAKRGHPGGEAPSPTCLPGHHCSGASRLDSPCRSGKGVRGGGESGPWGSTWARWNYLQWRFGWGSSASSVAFMRSLSHFCQHVCTVGLPRVRRVPLSKAVKDRCGSHSGLWKQKHQVSPPAVTNSPGVHLRSKLFPLEST